MDTLYLLTTILSLFHMLYCTGTDLTRRLQMIFNRTDIMCPQWCLVMSCCVCSSEVTFGSLGTLKVNVSHDNGTVTSELSVIGLPSDKYQVTYIGRQNKLRALPTNLCEFLQIVKMDLSNNSIVDIDGLKCLPNLDTLILRGNQIGYLKKKTFISMQYLRELDMSYNRLSYIEPGFLFNMRGSLSTVDFSHNLLKTVDITNIIWSKQYIFCHVDYSYNLISEVLNEQQWICRDSDNFGDGGMVSFTHNKFTNFVNFADLGFANVHLLGKLFSYGFDFRYNKWFCDCKMYAFALKAATVADKIYRDYFKLQCHSPAELKNEYILDMIDSNTLHRLICNLTLAERCPPKCRCYYQPDRWRTVINCANTGRTSLPSALPHYSKLEADFSRNDISSLLHVTLDNVNYFQNVSKLDLSVNKIQELPDAFFFMVRFAGVINTTGNEISHIPRALQMLNPCRIFMGVVQIKCRCDHLWLITWLKSRHGCRNNTVIQCKTERGYINILHMSTKDLGCHVNADMRKWNLLLGSLLVAALVISFIIFNLRFETYVLGRTLYKRVKSVNVDSDKYSYDVYISCDDDDDALRQWLTSYLVPHLDRKGYRVYLPFRDNELGRPREEEIIEIVPRCLNYIMFLSDNKEGFYEVWNRKEWKYCWHNYKADINHEIVVVNYDMLKTGDVIGRYVTAFLRLGKYIDFSNRSKHFEEKILKLLQTSVNLNRDLQNDLNVSKTNIFIEFSDKNIEARDEGCENLSMATSNI